MPINLDGKNLLLEWLGLSALQALRGVFDPVVSAIYIPEDSILTDAVANTIFDIRLIAGTELSGDDVILMQLLIAEALHRVKNIKAIKGIEPTHQERIVHAMNVFNLIPKGSIVPIRPKGLSKVERFYYDLVSQIMINLDEKEHKLVREPIAKLSKDNFKALKRQEQLVVVLKSYIQSLWFSNFQSNSFTFKVQAIFLEHLFKYIPTTIIFNGPFVANWARPIEPHWNALLLSIFMNWRRETHRNEVKIVRGTIPFFFENLGELPHNHHQQPQLYIELLFALSEAFATA